MTKLINAQYKLVQALCNYEIEKIKNKIKKEKIKKTNDVNEYFGEWYSMILNDLDDSKIYEECLQNLKEISKYNLHDNPYYAIIELENFRDIIQKYQFPFYDDYKQELVTNFLSYFLKDE